MATDSIGISLAQAQELVALLEQGKQEEADAYLGDIVKVQHDELFTSVGRLTRDLHDSLQEFHVDPRIETLMEDELPDAKNRLNYVIQRTEDAANRTMNAVEASLPIAEQMHNQVGTILPVWDRLMSNDIELSEFKQLCHDVDAFVRESGQHAAHLQGLLTEVLMAQDYQDITGQVIRKVIDLVQDVEQNLIELLKVFGKREDSSTKADKEKAKPDNIGAEGPIIDPEQRDDVVQGQDEVDDLLSSLGF
ncbi:protein phosphatase [Thalassospira xiamenensis]|nr:protein phosphatase [Thalassospira xiamenensis]